jgi:hypothetical protein
VTRYGVLAIGVFVVLYLLYIGWSMYFLTLSYVCVHVMCDFGFALIVTYVVLWGL